MSTAPKLSDEALEYFRKEGARGGEARAKNLSKKRRQEIAREAGKNRWKNRQTPQTSKM